MNMSNRGNKHNKEIGNLGEELAKNYLIQQGYSILASNYRCSRGELDIIAMDKDIIVFVEVKTRTNSKFGQPFEAVDQRKIRRLYTIAEYFIHERKLNEYKYRFDIVSILLMNPNIVDEKDYSISLIKNVIS